MKQTSPLIENCEHCPFRAKAVVCDLAGEAFVAFQKIKRSLTYEPHQIVFDEGDACLGLYLLCMGTVKLTRSSARGQRQIVRILGNGELIEKDAFREHAVHEATCETLERSQICVIEKEPYLALIQGSPELAIKLIQLLSRELGVHMDQLDQFTFETARGRLATLLLELGERFGKKTAEGVLIGITLKREEVAEIVGTTVQTVLHLLGALRDEGLIGLDGRTITLLKPDRLARIARL